MADHIVTREHGATKGRFLIRRGDDEAELTYSVTTPTLIIADHTGVPDTFRGTGAGLALVQALVAAANSSAPIELPFELPEHAPVLRLLVKGAEAATAEEIAVNPRAASVRLRAAEKIRRAA